MNYLLNSIQYDENDRVKNVDDLVLGITYLLISPYEGTEAEFCLMNIDYSKCNYKARIRYYLSSLRFYIYKFYMNKKKLTFYKHVFLGIEISGKITTKSKWMRTKVDFGYTFKNYWIDINTKKEMFSVNTKILLPDFKCKWV